MAGDNLSTPDLSDAAPEARAIELPFRNFGAIRQFGGQVVTIKCHEDNSLVKECVEEPGEGRVIVVDGGGSRRRSLLGDMLAEKAAANGWAGLVINGVATRRVRYYHYYRGSYYGSRTSDTQET